MTYRTATYIADKMTLISRTPAAHEDPDIEWLQVFLKTGIEDALYFLEPDAIAAILDKWAAVLRQEPTRRSLHAVP